MKNITKTFLSLISVLLIISSLSACSNGNYTDTKSAQELSFAIEPCITTDGGTKMLDSDAILEISDTELSYLKDFVMIRANNTKNINEYGIFRVESGKTEDMKKLLSTYVENKQKTYRAMDYFPEETEKIDCATVEVFGNYVVYSFLNENDTEAFHNAIKDQISK